MVGLDSIDMTKHFIYVLESAYGNFYTGYTTDLKRRMQEHKEGRGAKFTKAFGFRKLLYHETFRSKSVALKREAEIKSWPKDKKAELIQKIRD